MRRRAVLTFAILAVTTMASACLSPGDDDPMVKKVDSGARPVDRAPGTGVRNDTLTSPIYGMLPKTSHYLRAAIDDIQLYTEVYLPDGPGPWPAILINSPYYDHGVNANLDPEAGFRTYFVPRGYAVVLADVRGTGYSEGCMNMMGAKEQRDTYDLVEWVANQSWSDGKVGMYGVSYVGTTPHEALIMAPPHLVTVVTVAGVTNQWRNMYQNGVPYQGRFYPLTYEAVEGAPPPGDADRGPLWLYNTAAGSCEQEEMVEHVTPPTYTKGVYDDYWLERNFTLNVKNAKASIFYNQGFTDRAVNPMEAVYWYNEIETPKKAFYGQWAHRTPDRKDWQETLNAWFDHWLKGIENGIMESPPVEVVTNDGRIRVDDEWPPTDAANLRLHLSAGELTTTVPGGGSETYVADNAASSQPSVPSTPPGLPTILEYSTEPLEQDVYMSGFPMANLRASSDQENTYFLLSLYKVNATATQEVAEGWMNAHLWKSFDQSNPLEPGKGYSFQFKFEPREYVFEKGSRIVLAIKGHDSRVFPFDTPVAMNTIEYGAEGSYLDLPVITAPLAYERPSDI